MILIFSINFWGEGGLGANTRLWVRIDLQQALDTGEPDAPVRALRGIKHEDRRWELGEARKAAALRSGVRGLRARKELKALEETVACEEARYVSALGAQVRC